MGLNAEFNRPVAGLQLRLEGLNVVFLELRVIKIVPKNFQSESHLQSPNPEGRTCKEPKT